MKIIKTIVLVSGGLILLAVGGYILFTISYQRIINESSIISDKQCLFVNPLIIERKKSYIKSTTLMLSGGDPKEYWAEQERYLALSKKYMAAQDAWLQEQKQLMDRWDYQLIVPQLVKDAGRYQYISRKAEVEGTRALVQLFVSIGDPERQKQLTQIILDENKKQHAANKAYDHLWDTAPKNDIRMRFIKIPLTTCPAENFNIPDTDDLFNPKAPAGDGPSPTNTNG
jgi:hypothetical protein